MSARMNDTHARHNICDLPEETIMHILAYVTYDDLAKSRSVCRLFDKLARHMLNDGFRKLERYHSHCTSIIKSQMPRRASERRNHPLSRRLNLLELISYQLSPLSGKYMGAVERKLCCFIPGKVIDEIRRLLHIIISENPNLPDDREFLQEMRDLSTMALEYFERNLAPNLVNRYTDQINISEPTDKPSTSGGYTSDPEIVLTNAERELLKQVQISQNSLQNKINALKLPLKASHTVWQREITRIRERLRKARVADKKPDKLIIKLKEELCELKKRMNKIE